MGLKPTSKPAIETEVAQPEVATEPTKAKKATKAIIKVKIASLKLREELLNEILNEEKNINEQIFRE